MRPESHIIDTRARRLVPLVFPSEWEHRELTGRDYGIDMIIEVFINGIPTGKMLSLQIKGTSLNIDDSTDIISYDIPVNTLRYSELFISPVILVICPINDKKNILYFLWLQEYIRVVLNYENPNWRLNKSKVRLHIPAENNILSNLEKLDWIANFPKRTFELCQLARICLDLEYNLSLFLNQSSGITSTKSLITEILSGIDELLGLDSLFTDANWLHSQHIKEDIILPAREIAIRLLNNESIDELTKHSILIRLHSLSIFYSSCSDYSYSRILWELEGAHNF